jgi:excinuclease ABC subunit B
VSVVDVAPLGGYEDHLLAQIERRIAKRERTLVTCITKSSAEALSEFLTGHGIASVALHSGVKPLERLRVLDDLRSGKLDVLVGCNLLREGLDLPQVSLVCVLNADKQGLLRSTTSLIQTIGRAARHIDGVALLYTESGRASVAMEQAIRETNRRRDVQLAHNKQHGVVPRAAGTILGVDGTTKGRPPASGGGGGGDSGGGGGGSILTMLSRDKPGGGSGGENRGPPGGELEGEDRELYEELRAWRGRVARAGRRRRPFMILTEAVMQGLAVARPSNMEELLAVKGVGPKKAEMFGDAILQIIRSNEGSWVVNDQEYEFGERQT